MMDKIDGNKEEMKEMMEMKEMKAEEEAEAKATAAAEEAKPVIAAEEPEPVIEAEPAEEPKPVIEAEPEKAPAPVITAEVKAEPETTAKTKPERTGYRSEIDGVEVDFELQYRDRETDMKDIAKRVTEDYAKRGNDASKIELIQIYLKPTDFTAYYVVNNSYEGKIPLF